MRTLIPRIYHKVVHLPSVASWCPFERKKTEFEVLIVTVAELIAYTYAAAGAKCKGRQPAVLEGIGRRSSGRLCVMVVGREPA